MCSRRSTRPAGFSRMPGRVPCPPGACNLIGKMNTVEWMVVCFPPKNSNFWIPSPQCDGSWRGDLRELIRLAEVMGAEPLGWGLCPYGGVKRPELSSLCHGRTRWEVGHYRAGRGPFPDPALAGAGTLNLVSQNWERRMWVVWVTGSCSAARAKMMDIK